MTSDKAAVVSIVISIKPKIHDFSTIRLTARKSDGQVFDMTRDYNDYDNRIGTLDFFKALKTLIHEFEVEWEHALKFPNPRPMINQTGESK
jgi:FKBP-type peptidyl-prolyl cis-trans isomerase 2